MRSLKTQFNEFSIEQVPRSLNTQADALASLGLTSEPILRRTIPVEYVEKPSIEIVAITTANLID